MQKASNYSDDAYQVEFAARQLGRSEFKLFGDAYQAWFGNKPAQELVEYCFNRYLHENVMPFWVRDYVRKFFYDPVLQKHLGKKRKVTACCYVVPIVVEYVVIIYFLL